jgi:hypothetical protein
MHSFLPSFHQSRSAASMRHSVAAGNILVCSGPAVSHHAALNLHSFVLCTCKRVRQGGHALDQVLACVLHPLQITPRTICYWAAFHLGPTWGVSSEGIPPLGKEPCLTTHHRIQGCPRTAVLLWLVQRNLPSLHSYSRTAKCESLVTSPWVTALLLQLHASWLDGTVTSANDMMMVLIAVPQPVFQLSPSHFSMSIAQSSLPSVAQAQTQRLHGVALAWSRCTGARSWQLPEMLTTAPLRAQGGTCEMQCSDLKAKDVSCGGTMSAYTVYVLKGVQGECRPSPGYW